MSDGSELDFIAVTPEMAKGFLAKFDPDRVRTATDARVDRYARMMAAGQWMRAGEPVGVTEAGQFINGRHRLMAIVQSGCTITLPFQYRMHPDAVKVIDTGKSREYKHFLQIEGTSQAKTLGPLVRRMFLWDAGIYHQPSAAGKSKPSPATAELDAYLDAHPDLHEAAAAASGDRPPHMSPTAYAVCLVIFRRVAIEAADEFCNAWLTGANLETGHPLLALRDRLTRDAATKSGRLGEDKIALAFVAWNAWREGRRLARINLPPGFSNAHYPHPR